MPLDTSIYNNLDTQFGQKLGAIFDPVNIAERQNRLSDLANGRAMQQMQMMQGALSLQETQRKLADQAAMRQVLQQVYGSSGAPQSPVSSPAVGASATNITPYLTGNANAATMPNMANYPQGSVQTGEGITPKAVAWQQYKAIGDKMAANGLVDQAQQYYTLAEKFRPKLKDEQVRSVNGQPVVVRNYEDGSSEISPYSPIDKTEYQDIGGKLLPRSGLTGAILPGSINKTATPGEILANARDVARLNYEGIPIGGASPGSVPGIKPSGSALGGQPPAPNLARQIPIPPGMTPKAASEYIAKLSAEKPKDLTALEDNVASIDQAIEQAKSVMNHPGLSAATGRTALLATTPYLDPDAYDAKKKIETLKGQVMLGVLKQMKSLSPTGASGFGQLSNAEGDTLRNSITNLENAQSEGQVKEALSTVINAMNNAKDRMTRGYQRIYGETPDIKNYSSIPQSNVPLTNQQGWALHTDARGNKAYVSPDGKQFQEVK